MATAKDIISTSPSLIMDEIRNLIARFANSLA